MKSEESEESVPNELKFDHETDFVKLLVLCEGRVLLLPAAH